MAGVSPCPAEPTETPRAHNLLARQSSPRPGREAEPAGIHRPAGPTTTRGPPITTEDRLPRGRHQDADAPSPNYRSSANGSIWPSFPRPDEYDPHRPNLNDHVAFGHGLHYCLGAYLARMELRVVLDLLTTRLPGLRPMPGQEITHSSNFTLRGLDHLLATVSADTPAASQPKLSNAPLPGAR